MSAHERRQSEWDVHAPLFEQIVSQTLQAYTDALSDLAGCFELQDRFLRCIDEGTVGGIHAAGSGILMEEGQVIHAMKSAGIQGVYSHAGCGAAALYAKQNGLDLSKPDEYGKQWATRLAGLLNVPYKGHIEAHEMVRPADMHNARAVYYDGTGVFDPSRSTGLPSGFVISRRYLDPAYAKTEAGVAASIALGDHGFHDLITSNQPFFAIAVGDPTNEAYRMESLMMELEEIANAFEGRVMVLGFNRP